MNKRCDLHIHLGGSISKDLLIEYAKLDNNQQAVDDFEAASIAHKFKTVHQFINSPDRIEDSTKNVIETSTADYLELRTTPRNFSSSVTLHHYVEAFVSALQQYPDKAKGLLSIDRYKHNSKNAQEIITLALQFPNHIVGIDISGINPAGTRILRGEALKSVIETVLNSPLGLAIHIGELDQEKERLDSTITFNTIDQWIERNSNAECTGKIRLGHALFLEEEHRKIVHKHQLPIEICPSCHRYIGAWKQGNKHPVQKVYSDKMSPIVIGTDDTLIFTTSFEKEIELARNELPYNLENACKYRFK